MPLEFAEESRFVLNGWLATATRAQLNKLAVDGSASNRVLTGLLDRLLRGRYPAGCKQNRGCLRGRAFVF